MTKKENASVSSQATGSDYLLAGLSLLPQCLSSTPVSSTSYTVYWALRGRSPAAARAGEGRERRKECDIIGFQ